MLDSLLDIQHIHDRMSFVLNIGLNELGFFGEAYIFHNVASFYLQLKLQYNVFARSDSHLKIEAFAILF